MKFIIDYNWVRYKNVREMCKAHNCNYWTYYRRMAECRKLGIKPRTEILLNGF